MMRDDSGGCFDVCVWVFEEVNECEIWILNGFFRVHGVHLTLNLTLHFEAARRRSP